MVRACVVMLFVAGALAQAPDRVEDLRKFTGLTPYEWKSVEAGKIAAKVVNTSYKLEVAVIGVDHVRVSRKCFLEQFRDIELFKKSPAVLQIGKFSAPVKLQDLARLTLDSEDAARLPDCRIGSCTMKVPVRMIQRLRSASSGELESEADLNSLFRDELLSYLQSYIARGNDALVEYRDKSTPVSLAAQFHSMLDDWPALQDSAPQLYDSLRGGSKQPGEPLEVFFYWSKESFGLKPVISITQVIIDQRPDETWIASKQIYADHYFDASLGITVVLDDPADSTGNTIYLAYLNRSRIDLLGGVLGPLRRSLVRGRLQEGMKKNLRQTAEQLEAGCKP
jgi:hypothetical protein